jgi:hypothetical protein
VRALLIGAGVWVAEAMTWFGGTVMLTFSDSPPAVSGLSRRLSAYAASHAPMQPRQFSAGEPSRANFGGLSRVVTRSHRHHREADE